MKRKWIIGITLLVLVAFAIPALAATNSSTDVKSWFDQMFSAKKATVDQAVKNGTLTAEQGQAWKDHLDQMYKFHEQNGFVCPFGGPGMGYGRGQGRGMMGGFGGNGWGGQTPVPPAQTN